MTRTTAVIGERRTSGIPCEACGTGYDLCTDRVLGRGGWEGLPGKGQACCSACGWTDTHRTQDAPVPAIEGDDLRRLWAMVRRMSELMREQADDAGTRYAWEAHVCLERSLYDLGAAAANLCRHEDET